LKGEFDCSYCVGRQNLSECTTPLTLAGLSLRDLEYALAVAETRHFGRAAERCGVSQPALSEQIRKLEALLGVGLFERGRRGVQITADGEILLARAERLLADAQELLRLAHGHADTLESTLRLAAIQTLGPYYLPFLLRQVREAFPKLGLRLREGQTEPLIEGLRNGALDLVLAALPLPSDGLATVALFREPFVLVCPVGHKLGSLPRITLDDLANEGLILLEDGHCLRDHALSLCAGAAPASRLATSLETLWHMIASGEGFSLLPALSLAGRGAMDGLVVCRELMEPEAGRTIALAWRATDPRDAALRRFAESLRSRLPHGARPLS
jgi:LysR family hydrogen peroxide-inducible transcriptional activator